MIKGFEIAVMYLNIQSKAIVNVRSDLAYGKVGQPPHIPGDSDLVIDLEVLSYHEVGKESISIMSDF